MTDCPNETLRDLLPEYAHGALGPEDAAQVKAHLAGCEACRAELALLAQLRAGLAQGVPTVDVAAIVRALPSPATQAPRRPMARRWVSRHAWQYAAAAGLILAAGSGIVWKYAPEVGARRVADSSHVAKMATAESVPSPTASADEGITFGGGMSDLSVDDLQLLLGQMDSLKTLPSSDPQSVTPVIAINDGGKTL